MRTRALSRIAAYCDRLLNLSAFRDWSGALNGLQAENDGRVSRLAAAVDAGPTTLRMAAEAGADLLLVHHGLFWTPRQPWTGPARRLFRFLTEHNLAVYSAHLPLDAHPELGNNIGLCRALGFRNSAPFLESPERGCALGLRVRSRISRERLLSRIESAVGTAPRLIPYGPALCRSIGIAAGGAGELLAQAAAEGVDTFITGEGPHWTFTLAEELGVNVFYAGHYATETFGVRALAEHLSRRFQLPWSFLDRPTGL